MALQKNRYDIGEAHVCFTIFDMESHMLDLEEYNYLS